MIKKWRLQARDWTTNKANDQIMGFPGEPQGGPNIACDSLCQTKPPTLHAMKVQHKRMHTPEEVKEQCNKPKI